MLKPGASARSDLRGSTRPELLPIPLSSPTLVVWWRPIRLRRLHLLESRILPPDAPSVSVRSSGAKPAEGTSVVTALTGIRHSLIALDQFPARIAERNPPAPCPWFTSEALKPAARRPTAVVPSFVCFAGPPRMRCRLTGLAALAALATPHLAPSRRAGSGCGVRGGLGLPCLRGHAATVTDRSTQRGARRAA